MSLTHESPNSAYILLQHLGAMLRRVPERVPMPTATHVYPYPGF